MEVLQRYDCPVKEATAECNPETDKDTFARLKSAGIDRVSIGAQSFIDEELKALGRRHTALQSAEAVRAAAQAGFTNISIDLMCGQDLQNSGRADYRILKNLDVVSTLPLTHVSLYMLKIEQGTEFYGKGVKTADDDIVCDEYELSCDYLAKRGFQRYEISNFAKKGFESKHNLKYWRAEEYLGIGASAHSFINGRRTCCPSSLEKFTEEIVTEAEVDGVSEYIMLGLRLSEGVSLERLHHAGAEEKFLSGLAAIPKNLYIIKGDRVALTTKGFLISNKIIARLCETF